MNFSQGQKLPLLCIEISSMWYFLQDDARTLFSQLSKQMVRALYDKYRLDFQMFDYDIKDFIKYASESEGFLPDVIEILEKKEAEETGEEGEEGDEEVTDGLSTSDVTEKSK